MKTFILYQRLNTDAVRILSLIVLALAGTGSNLCAQVDADGDGLLDLVDHPSFDSNLGGDLSFVSIEDLDGANQLTRSISLSFYDNQITSVEAGDFEGLYRLQTLDLSLNQITSVEAGDFAGLTYLQELDLSGNQITGLEPNAFADLTFLRRLSLSGNRTTSVEAGDFAGLTHLQELYLDGQQIGNIEKDAFADLVNLQYLAIDSPSELNLQGVELESLKSMSGTSATTNLLLDDAHLSASSFITIMRYASSTLREASLIGLSFSGTTPRERYVSRVLSRPSLINLTIDTYLYSLYQDEFDAFSDLEGKTLTIVDPDCNGDGVVDIVDANCTLDRRIEYFLEDYGTLPGDADGMGGVDFADFLILNGNFGDSPAVYTDGDFDADGIVGFSDFLLLSGNYGQGDDFTAGADTAAVPEPSSLLYLLLAMAGMLPWFRQNQATAPH